MTGSYNLTGKICRCPTPRGVRKLQGWDTRTAVDTLRVPRTGRLFFVPPVRPLDAFDTGARACAPVQIGSRGRTHGTKFQVSVYGREKRYTAGRVSHPMNRGNGTPAECPTPRGGV